MINSSYLPDDPATRELSSTNARIGFGLPTLRLYLLQRLEVSTLPSSTALPATESEANTKPARQGETGYLARSVSGPCGRREFAAFTLAEIFAGQGQEHYAS
ncbi:MAG: hypothetical protein RMJ16_03845 [Thermoguttaceae bacterium]|nr:hypothetical protein [Thermoguttaceae bacterium]